MEVWVNAFFFHNAGGIAEEISYTAEATSSRKFL